ncbi:hypothetical protein VKT23_009691 [Stygiomarasmius scandens]|uniref:F-box domain-containing protein n=1 Tax=Marasmiellus scandens TaxID=2682957 RepID=A0ABR1JFU5_9AGAR
MNISLKESFSVESSSSTSRAAYNHGALSRLKEGEIHDSSGRPTIEDLITMAGAVELNAEQLDLVRKVVDLDRSLRETASTQGQTGTLLPDTTHDFIFRHLSPIDLHRYSLQNRAAYKAVQSFRKRAFDINKLLCRYFSPTEIPQFRHIQFTAGVLISGSSALQYFDRTVYPESDLDLYVCIQQCSILANFLESCGYVFQPRDSQQSRLDRNIAQALSQASEEQLDADYPLDGIAGIFTLVRDGQKIQIIAANGSTLEVVLHFHSTCVMNVITHANAYSFFPRATFETRRSVLARNNSSVNNASSAATRKYTARGWAIVDTVTSLESLGPHSEFSSFGIRHAGDSACWVIPLSPVEGLASGDDLWLNSWRVVWEHNRCLKLDFSVIQNHGFRFGRCIVKEISRDMRSPDGQSLRNDEELGRMIKELTSATNKQLEKCRQKLYSIIQRSGLETPALPSACAGDRLVAFLTDLYTSFTRDSIGCTFQFQKDIPCRGKTWLRVFVVIKLPRRPRRAFNFTMDKNVLADLRCARVEVEVKQEYF